MVGSLGSEDTVGTQRRVAAVGWRVNPCSWTRDGPEWRSHTLGWWGCQEACKLGRTSRVWSQPDWWGTGPETGKGKTSAHIHNTHILLSPLRDLGSSWSSFLVLGLMLNHLLSPSECCRSLRRLRTAALAAKFSYGYFAEEHQVGSGKIFLVTLELNTHAM